MQETANRIEKIFADLRKDIPNLTRLSFEAALHHGNEIYGWYWIKGKPTSYWGIDKLISAMDKLKAAGRRENEILFRKF